MSRIAANIKSDISLSDLMWSLTWNDLYSEILLRRGTVLLENNRRRRLNCNLIGITSKVTTNSKPVTRKTIHSLDHGDPAKLINFLSWGVGTGRRLSDEAYGIHQVSIYDSLTQIEQVFVNIKTFVHSIYYEPVNERVTDVCKAGRQNSLEIIP